MQDDIWEQFNQSRVERKTLGWFPPAYPDELWYSICARYKEIVRYRNQRDVQEDLTGVRKSGYSVIFPGSLGNITGSLPTSWGYTTDKIIDEHTLLPIFAPFMATRKMTYLRNLMSMNTPQRTEAASGVFAGRIPAVGSPRLCRTCVEQDRERFGECYWHRTHQVYGVQICHLHTEPLMIWQGKDSWSEIRLQLISAEQALTQGPFVAGDIPLEWQAYLLKVAIDVHWLLAGGVLGSDLEHVLQKYRMIIANLGLGRPTGVAAVLKSQVALEAYYPKGLLAFLGCDIGNEGSGNWLSKVFGKDRTLQGPLLHLLLIQFLGYSAQSLSQEPENQEFFGPGPWLCLNPGHQGYMQPIIESCEIEWTYKRRQGDTYTLTPRGVFTCQCGMVFTRCGPDTTQTDKYRYTSIRVFGDVWKAYLIAAWSDKSKTVSEIASELQMSIPTVASHTRRLGLQPRKGTYKNPVNQTKGSGRGYRSSLRSVDTVTQARDAWTAALQMSDNPTLASLINIAGKQTYRLLMESDRTWLNENRPLSRQGAHYLNVTYTAKDWRTLDAELESKVRECASILRSQSGKPVHITTRSIASHLEISYSLVYTDLDKLPLTNEALSKEVESFEEWGIRRIRWAVEQYVRENVRPSRSRLIQCAGVLYLVRSNAESIVTAIGEAVELLSE